MEEDDTLSQDEPAEEASPRILAPLPRGILAPLPTPFDEDGEIDRAALGQLIDFYVERGVHALFAFGVAGQGPAMRADQRRTAAELIFERAAGRVPVILHVGTADVQTTLQIARHGDALGPAGLAISPPYYFSDHTPYEISAHYAAVAEAVEAPILIYDNPRYAGIGMSPAATARLARALPTMTGIILENPSLDLILQHLRALPPEFAIYSGAIECVLPTAPYGLAGAASAPASPFPDLCVRLWEAIQRRDFEQAFVQQRQLNELAATVERYAITTGRTVYRDVFRLRGIDIKRYPRWPSQDLEEEVLHRLHEEIDALGGFALPPAAVTEPPPADGSPEVPAEPVEEPEEEAQPTPAE